jgi:hypothetical protein
MHWVGVQYLVYAQAAYYTADPQKCARKLGASGLEVTHTVKERVNIDGTELFAFTAVDTDKERGRRWRCVVFVLVWLCMRRCVLCL